MALATVETEIEKPFLISKAVILGEP